jgi:hypothetical protein
MISLLRGKQRRMPPFILLKWLLMCALAAVMAAGPAAFGQQLPNLDGQPKWPDQDWLESSLKEVGKKLEIIKDINKPGQDIEFFYSKASELQKRAVQERENFYRCERLVNAANVLLNAAYGVYSSRKADRAAQDFWGAGRMLQGLYFRVQQADFFVSMSGEKNADQYVTQAKSFHQQARSAYDAHEYQKSKYLADASFAIVTALESIVQAAIPPPKTPGIYK